MHSDYELFRIGEDRYEHFRALAGGVFGHESSFDNVHRLFDTAAFGAKHIGYIAYEKDSGNPAAFYGVFPSRVEYEKVTYLAAQSGSTMTHPDHRKRGLFYETAKKTFDLAKSEGIRFIFGFPNDSSFPGFKKLGWSVSGNFNTYQWIVPTPPLGVLASRSGIGDRILRSRFAHCIEEFRIEYVPTANSVIEPNVGGVHRDADLLRYKPETSGRMVLSFDGIRVWLREMGGSLGIGDIGPVENADQLKEIIARLRHICIRSGISRIVTHLSPDSQLDRMMKKSGYRPRPGLPICHFDLGSGLPLDNFRFVYGDFDTF